MSAEPPKLALTVDNVASYWCERWDKEQTRWKCQEVAAPFKSNLDAFAAAAGVVAASRPLAGKAVLVPLCGDSAVVPFAALECGAALVVGVDLASSALAAARAQHFPNAVFAESVLDGGEASGGVATMWAAEIETQAPAAKSRCRVEYICGDILAPSVRARCARRFHFVYDRAAIVALPPALRAPYAEFVGNALVAGSTPIDDDGGGDDGGGGGALGAYVELVRRVPEDAALGPPYDIPNEQVARLYEPHGLLLRPIDELPSTLHRANARVALLPAPRCI